MPRVKDPEQVYRSYLNRQYLVSGGTVAPNWTSDGEGCWLVERTAQDARILRISLATGQAQPLIELATLRASLQVATGEEVPPGSILLDTLAVKEDGRCEFSYGSAQWRFDPATAQVERAGEVTYWAQKLIYRSASEAERHSPKIWLRGVQGAGYLNEANVEVPEQRSPSEEWFVSIQDHNIVLRSPRDGREQRLTRCGTPERFWDVEALCVKNLPGRIGQVGQRVVSPWSPDSLTLLAYRRDMSGVFHVPRMHWLKPFEEVDYTPFQKAGARIHRIEPVFIDLRSGCQCPVALPDIEDRYIQLLAWHPAGEEALIIVYTRDLRCLDIFAASRDTGAVRTLLHESAPTALKILLEEVFSNDHGFDILPDGTGFLWRSTRDGYSHLYRYDWQGQLIAQLTSGAWPVYCVEHIGPDGFVYFSAAIDTARPYDVHVCRVPLKGGAIEQLTREKGLHTPVFSPGGRAFIDTHSATDRPTRTDLVKADGTRLRVLSEMNIGRLRAVGYTPAEEFTVQAADGATELWGVMYRPFDFDPSRSYPVIECIYGGPQLIWAQRFFAINELTLMNLAWALAHRGYVTICLDGRGTPGRSKAFQDVVHGHWTAGFADHAGAIRQLCARHSWMDANRVGIYGHSWGGYFATYALIGAPDTYHAAVAAEPGFDPWQGTGHEPYLDLPQRNRAAYDDANLIRQAAQVRRPLMFLSGTRYARVASSAMKMTRALIEAGVDHEFVVVPNATHLFQGAEEEYLYKKLTGWFDRHVKHRQPG